MLLAERSGGCAGRGLHDGLTETSPILPRVAFLTVSLLFRLFTRMSTSAAGTPARASGGSGPTILLFLSVWRASTSPRLQQVPAPVGAARLSSQTSGRTVSCFSFIPNKGE